VAQQPASKSKYPAKLIAIVGGLGGLLIICMICGLVGSLSRGKATPTPSALAVAVNTAVPAGDNTTEPPKRESTDTPVATEPPVDTATPEPTPTPAPTNTPVPTPIPTEPPKPIVLQGSGQTATDALRLPSAISVAKFTHNGSRNFVVWTYVGNNRDLLINTIGAYEGARPIVAQQPVMFDIDADGSWSVTITPLQFGGVPEFSGHGDSVSAAFDPPPTGAWLIKHDGQRNFVVWCHCAGGSALIQNEIGQVDASRVISFDEGPCFWEVIADGNWSLAPR
jgi:hypothetical protein